MILNIGRDSTGSELRKSPLIAPFITGMRFKMIAITMMIP